MKSQSHCALSHNFCELFPNLVECLDCGLGKTLTVRALPSQQDYRLMTHDARRARLAYCRSVLEALQISLLTPGISLDVGCESGTFREHLQELGWEAFGLEPFPGDYGPRVFNATLNELSRDTRGLSFDLITLFHSFEHLPDPSEAAHQLFRLLRPGGQLVVAVPNFAGYWSKLTGAAWPWLNVTEHYYHFTPRSLAAYFENASFEKVWTCLNRNEGPSLLKVLMETGNWSGLRKAFKHGGGAAEILLRARRPR